jgi:hypothetical protein
MSKKTSSNTSKRARERFSSLFLTLLVRSLLLIAKKVLRCEHLKGENHLSFKNGSL